MTAKSDPSQGMVPLKQPKATPVREPDGKAILRGIKRGVNAAERAAKKSRPPQKVDGKQDWRRG